jgi:hypothetical protein
MSFVRPEAQATLWRWREVLVGAGLVALGGLLTFRIGLIAYAGWILVALGVVLVVSGIQRARFRRGDGGPGIVTLDEGQITYFGPLSGGVIAVREMVELTVDPTGRPTHWLLKDHATEVAIPETAEGADKLFDVFATLPGLSTEKMLATLEQAEVRTVIWRDRSGMH